MIEGCACSNRGEDQRGQKINIPACNTPAWSPDQRDHKSKFSFLKNASTFQNYYFHHDRTWQMNNDNFQAHHISLLVQDYNVCIPAFE
jgi:hypothetical protein